MRRPRLGSGGGTRGAAPRPSRALSYLGGVPLGPPDARPTRDRWILSRQKVEQEDRRGDYYFRFGRRRRGVFRPGVEFRETTSRSGPKEKLFLEEEKEEEVEETSKWVRADRAIVLCCDSRVDVGTDFSTSVGGFLQPTRSRILRWARLYGAPWAFLGNIDR